MPQRMENYGVVRNYQTCTQLYGFIEYRLGDIHTEQGALHFGFGVADQKPRIVVILLQPQRLREWMLFV